MVRPWIGPSLGALLVSLLAGSVSGAKSGAPNVLVIMADDQDLQLNSMNYMPNVQKYLTEKGTTFQHHYCTSALCCPSRVSLWTGKCVHNTNVTSVVMPFGGYDKFIENGLVNDYLPLWLEKGGVNSYYVGKFANGHSIDNYKTTPLKGWTSTHCLLDPGTYDYVNSTWAIDQEDWTSHLGEHVLDLATKNTVDMIDKAVAAGKPWLMTVAPAVPHLGINASNKHGYYPISQDKWKHSFLGDQVPRTPNWNPPTLDSGAAWLLKLPRQNDSTIAKLDGLYRDRARVIAGLDDMVGALVERLDKHGVLDNTHIVYTSDNGYHIGQHRMGPGKKQGYETDINVPFVWRGPGVKENENSTEVSTHTDLAPTFLSLFGLPMADGLDGRPIPALTGDSKPAGEHVNIELWGGAAPYELALPWELHHPQHPQHIKIKELGQNTYKGLRIIGSDYSLYYSVWCNNDHELYDMVKDPYQIANLLSNTTTVVELSKQQTEQTYLDRPLQAVLNRLDALMMVLKSCKGDACTTPWTVLHENGNVTSLKDAVNSQYDDFYSKQPKVSFSECKDGYFPEFEGEMKVNTLKGEDSAAAMLELSLKSLAVPLVIGLITAFGVGW